MFTFLPEIASSLVGHYTFDSKTSYWVEVQLLQRTGQKKNQTEKLGILDFPKIYEKKFFFCYHAHTKTELGLPVPFFAH